MVRTMEKSSLGDGRATVENQRAVLVELDTGETLWIPKSVIHDDSEVYGEDHEGDVVVARWWAEQEDLA
jgi:hypothetical protein